MGRTIGCQRQAEMAGRHRKMSGHKFLFIASDYKPRPGGRADYIDNLVRGLIAIGSATKVLAVLQSHHQEQLAFLERYEDWVIPFQVAYDQRPQNWLGNKLISLLEIARCLSPVAKLGLDKTRFFQASADSLARLDRILAREEPTFVVFGHLDMRLYPLALCLRQRRVPYGIIVHGREVPRCRARTNEFVRRRSVIKGATWIVANSRDTRSLVEVWGIPQSRISIVHPPIAEEAILLSKKMGVLPRNRGQLRLVTLCRLVRGKGIDIVLRALSLLSAAGIPFEYAIGGDGDERAFLEALAAELQLRDRVTFVGYINGAQKWQLLQNSDVFVMPSRVESGWVESFGIAFIEAAAFGLPAVGSRTGGIPDAIVDGVTGMLVEAESPEDLAEALTFLYQNSEKRIEMGKAGRERARRQFSPASVATDFQEKLLGCEAESLKSGARSTATPNKLKRRPQRFRSKSKTIWLI